jgi:diaminopimelate epimerase
MRVPFTKMHGLGNHFVVADAGRTPPPDPARIRALADPKRGIGFDQLLWLQTAANPEHDVDYRVFNTDGSEAEQCGNGVRCIARHVARPGQSTVRLGFIGGEVEARLEADGRVSAAMAVPRFAPADVPFRAETEADHYPITANGEQLIIGAVSMGNPHAVLRVDEVERAPVARLGPLLERHERFPNRANIGFMQVLDESRIRLRVFERGVGETEACGTGACAAVVVGRRWSLLGPRVTVQLPGGELVIRWEGPGQPVWMTGEAITVYEGTLET